MPLGDLGLTVALGLIVGLLGAVSEAVLFREPRSLWSAELYLRLGRSPLALWWREYWLSRGPMERREQFLVSFTIFFLVGVLCAVVFLALRPGDQ
jgi:hypothetical protein